jgi:phosphoglycerate dehydrogenase-like enzyme
MVTILVRQTKAHGIPSARCAVALRERLSDAEIHHASAPAEEQELVGDAGVVVGGSLGGDLLERARSLSLFACSSAGTGHLDLDAFERRGIAVTNASGVHGPNIAEHALAWLLSFAREMYVGERQQRRNEWRHYQSHGELNESTVTVVGLGAIGTTLVDRLSGFDCESLGVRHTPSKGGPTDEVFGFDEIHEPLSRSDYVVLACPLTGETEELIDGEAFRTMPSHAVLVNVARGEVVDADALVAALRGNKVRGAGLDVTDPEPLPPDHPLWDFGNVRITPHNAGHTPAYWERVADILAENLRRREAGEQLRNRVV